MWPTHQLESRLDMPPGLGLFAILKRRKLHLKDETERLRISQGALMSVGP
jgi:hypothetical protein